MIAVAAIYGRAVSFGFTTYDDPDYVRQNEHVTSGLSAENVRWALTTGHASNWHPLTWVSHMEDVEIFGLNAGGHHATSVLFHAANAVLLFLLLQLLTGATGRSAVAAALFSLHPLRVESVAWVAERKDVLSAFFGLAALLAYVRFARSGRLGTYLTSLGLFALALASKPMMVTLPFVLLLLDYWPLGRRGWGRLATEKLPYVALSAACAWATVVVQRGGGAMQAADTIPFVPRLINAIVSTAWYLWKTLLPTKLSPLYVHPALPGGTPWTGWQIALAVGVLAAISGLVWKHRQRGYPVVGWLWYLGTLAPVIGIVQVGGQAAADRYTYLPSIGLCLLVTWAAAAFLERVVCTATVASAAGAGTAAGVASAAGAVRRRPAWAKTGLIALPVALLAVYGVLARIQVGYWRDSRTLYEHALRLNPNNALMHNNLALVLADLGDSGGAERHFREALRVQPSYRQALEALADLRSSLGDAVEAEGLLGRALALRVPGMQGVDPARLRLLIKLGDASSAAGNPAEARRAYDEALRLQPDLGETEFRAGAALEVEGRLGEARKRFERALRLEPARADFVYRLGGLAAALGEPEAAVGCFEEAVRLDPSMADAQNNLGWMLSKSGRSDRGLVHLREAIRLRPDWDLPKQNLAWILATDPSDGIRDPATALELARETCATASPAPPQLETLAAALAAAGNYEEAIATAQAALRLVGPTRDAIWIARLQRQLEFYRAGRPYVAPPEF